MTDFKNIGAFKFDGEALDVEAIPTGSLALDKALGIGGIPRGRIVEFFGSEGSSKTTLCQHIVANSQKMGLKCAYIDMEHALDPKYMRKTGINLEELWNVQPDFGEEALDAVRAFIVGGIDVIVVDSVAALVPRAELEGDPGDTHVGLQARLMSQAMRMLSPTLKENNVTLIFTNQTRSTIGGYGRNLTTSGGRALRFYASVRLDMAHIAQIKDGDEVIGSQVRVKVRKNKVAPPYTQAEFPVIFGQGIDRTRELIDLGLQTKVVKRAGAWYTYGDIKSQGATNFAQDLNENNVLEQLETDVKNELYS